MPHTTKSKKLQIIFKTPCCSWDSNWNPPTTSLLVLTQIDNNIISIIIRFIRITIFIITNMISYTYTTGWITPTPTYEYVYFKCTGLKDLLEICFAQAALKVIYIFESWWFAELKVSNYMNSLHNMTFHFPHSF